MTALYYLVGPPASGKRTVGAALAAQTGAALIDNHLINDPVFTALGANGRDPLPPLAYDLAGDVRKIVEEAVLAAPDEVEHIFTNWLADTQPDAQLCRKTRQLAHTRHATFVPVWLTCRRAELTRRVVLPDRLGRNKLRDPDALAQSLDRNGTLPPPTDALLLDTSDLPPAEAAQQIVAFAAQISRSEQPATLPDRRY